jgi:large subunit ribosomal protein L17
MQRNILTSVLLYETVRTTKKRAEVVRPQVERLITVAKTKAPHLAIREINRTVTHKNASRKLMEVLKGRYAKRPSGYTRMTALGARRGDGAELVTLELVDREEAVVAPVAAEKKEKAPKKAKTPAKAKASPDSPTA